MQKITLPSKGDFVIALKDLKILQKKYSNSKPTEVITYQIYAGQTLIIMGGHNIFEDDGKVSLRVMDKDLEFSFGKDRDGRRTTIQLLVSQFSNKFAFPSESVLKYLSKREEIPHEDRFNDIDIDE